MFLLSLSTFMFDVGSNPPGVGDTSLGHICAWRRFVALLKVLFVSGGGFPFYVIIEKFQDF